MGRGLNQSGFFMGKCLILDNMILITKVFPFMIYVQIGANLLIEMSENHYLKMINEGLFYFQKLKEIRLGSDCLSKFFRENPDSNDNSFFEHLLYQYQVFSELYYISLDSKTNKKYLIKGYNCLLLYFENIKIEGIIKKYKFMTNDFIENLKLMTINPNVVKRIGLKHFLKQFESFADILDNKLSNEEKLCLIYEQFNYG